ncbi:MAG TPA: ATP-binding protein [Gemmatimonadales bacterium]|nr:ATP-binding protein [Gemmatimonadales bacterium]
MTSSFESPPRPPPSQALLAAIVESSDDAIISKTLEGIITSWNAGAERLFGYTPAEVIGHSITVIIPADRLDEEKVILQRLGRGERIEHYETVRHAKDGRLLDISLTISPIRDRAGKVVGVSKVARDIRAQKDAERALQEADRRKDEFLALLAHELRNPLGPIRHAVKILRARSPAPSELQWATSIIDRQAEHMSRLVEDLLDVSRITRGTIHLRQERLDIGNIVKSAVEASSALIDKAGHRLKVTLPPEPVFVDGDPTRLVQVVANLLDNAAKYTDPGGRIALTAAREGDAAVIRVKDNGIGIAPDVLPTIFDMFTQAGLTVERAQGGLGVGLSLVERLVHLHGGTVSAHSEGPGMGSEFTVRLPTATKGHDHLPWQTAGAEQKAHAHVRCRVLVVDDNQDSADSLGMLLRMFGHEVRTAHDGVEGVTAAAAFQPDIAILDIGLPKLNGYEVAKQIRAQPWGKRVALVALTGWGQEEHRRRSREAGFDHHLTKPVEMDVLQEILTATEHCLPERRLAAR